MGPPWPDESGQGNDRTLPASKDGYACETGRLGKALRLMASNRGHVSLPVGVLRGAADLASATWIEVTAASAALDRSFDVGVDAKLAPNKETGTAYGTFLLSDPFKDDERSFSSTRDGYLNGKGVAAPASAIPGD